MLAVLINIFLRNRQKKTSWSHWSFLFGAVGQPAGANRPEASPLNPQMIGKMGQAIMNGIKTNMEDQSNVELADQTNQQGNANTTWDDLRCILFGGLLQRAEEIRFTDIYTFFEVIM